MPARIRSVCGRHAGVEIRYFHSRPAEQDGAEVLPAAGDLVLSFESRMRVLRADRARERP
jgi:hypothetical protein